MSGGHFEYHQYYIDEIADSIDKYINGENIDDDEMKKRLDYLRKASIYAQRIDWLMSDDDGEEEFHERLSEELNNLKIKD